MRNSILRIAPAAVLLLAGALGGCAPERPEAVPADARSVARQTGQNAINFTAPDDGRIYVYDRSTQKMVYSGRLMRGETLEVDPRRNGVRVEGRQVVEAKLRDLNEYQVWFENEATARPSATAGPSETAGTRIMITPQKAETTVAPETPAKPAASPQTVVKPDTAVKTETTVKPDGAVKTETTVTPDAGAKSDTGAKPDGTGGTDAGAKPGAGTKGE